MSRRKLPVLPCAGCGAKCCHVAPFTEDELAVAKIAFGGLPEGAIVIPGGRTKAWDAFAYAVLEGLGVDRAYQHYLAARKGCDYVGGPAPDWDELRTNKPDIAAAWADAANALTPAP